VGAVKMNKVRFLVFAGVTFFLFACSSGEETANITDSDTAGQSDTNNKNDQLIIGDDSDSGSHNDGLEIPDADEDNVILGVDSDGDGIPDETEKPKGIAVDTDNDGTPDYQGQKPSASGVGFRCIGIIK